MKKSKLIKSASRTPNPVEDYVHRSEWTAAAKIMAWINEIIKEKNFPIGVAEVETIMPGTRKRPDIIIHKGGQSEEIICLMEFKLPYFEPDDEENLKEPARKKATKGKSPYFATSNFQSVIVFKTTAVNNAESLEEQIAGQYNLAPIEDINEIESPQFRDAIYRGLEKFLEEFADYALGRKPEPLIKVNELLVWRLHEKVNRLARYYKRIVEDKYHKDKDFRPQIKRWFTEQLWEFNAQDADFVKAARQTAYLLVNKIVFYRALQTKRPKKLDPLTIPDDLTKGGLLKQHLQNYFEYVVKNIDYETVYSADFIDTLAFPDDEAVVIEVRNLVKILKHYDFSRLGYDIIGYIFEKLIPAEERHNLGQYFTNSDIVDLILRFCLKNEDDKVLDPACGAGTFLVRAYQSKKMMNQRMSHEEILRDLWGADIAKFPAHLSTINLAISDLSVDKNYPNIIHDDFFRLLASSEGFELPDNWRAARAVSLGKKPRDVMYPRWFDCVVGNPPYTRQEEIPETGVDKHRLIENALTDSSGNKMAEISKRAGIHAYFFIHGTKFLKNGGRFGFIVSNSWLDTNYGKGLQEFFLKNYKIIAIVESKVERWFEDADINTCIVILEKCNNAKQRDENRVRFVYLKKTLGDLIPSLSENWEKKKARMDKIDELIKTILFHDEYYENEDIQIRPVMQKALWEEGLDKSAHSDPPPLVVREKDREFVGAKWGKYLRAPRIFFKIMEKCKDKLVPLKEIADVRRGFTTGANEFFYLTQDQIRKWKIEQEFWMHTDPKGNLVPNYVITSPKECKSIMVESEDLKYRVLLIHKDKKALKGTNMLTYIEWGERKKFNTRSTCESRGERWYQLSDKKPWPILHPMIHNDRQAVVLNNQGVYVDHNLFEINPEKGSVPVFAFLYSTVSAMIKELGGRINLGEGALKTEGIDVERLIVTHPKYYNPDVVTKLKKGIKKTNTIESLFTEIGSYTPDEVSLDKIKPDRRELDKIIMGDILGLSEDEQLQVYRAVVDLVRSRIERARSVGQRKQTKEGIDIEMLIRSVLSRMGDETLGKFYHENILTKPSYEKSLPVMEEDANAVKDLFKWHLSSGKNSVECATETEAEYLKCFAGTGLETVIVPKDEKYLKKILPELQELRKRTDSIIEDDVKSILSKKTQKTVLHLLWQEIMNPSSISSISGKEEKGVGEKDEFET